MSLAAENELDERRWQSLQLRVCEHHIEKIFEIFYRYQIEPILIKGWAAGRYYPNPARRFSSDIDLAVSSENYSRAQEIISCYPYDIDLHRELRHLDRMSWDNLFNDSKTVKLGDTAIRVLRREDHLRVICVHWLTDGGANKEKLWDIFYALQNRPADFDWERFLSSVGERRRKWFVCAVGLAQKYLGLNLKDTPLENAADELPDWLIETVEKEWRSEIRLRPLQRNLNDRRKFWQQVKKRFPPNPIQATVEMEGSFDDKPRIFYQIGSVLIRFPPSVKRIAKVLWRGKK